MTTDLRSTPRAPTADDRFQKLAAEFLEGYLRRSPVDATIAGDHRFDGTWPDMSAEGDADLARFLESTLASLDEIPKGELSLANRVDAAILENRARYGLFAMRELRGQESNPLSYTGIIGDGLDPLVTRGFGTLEERMQSLRGRLEGIPRIALTAKKRLANPPRVHTETAIEQNRGLVSLCKSELAEQFTKVPAMRADLEAAAGRAASALASFQEWLERELLPASKGDFRLGRERFEKKLRFELDADVAAEDLVASARTCLAETQEAMVETSREIWPTLFKGTALPPLETPANKRAFVRKVVARLGDDHPTSASVVTESRKLLADATRFVSERDIVRIPEDPCEVIEMPEYRRGVSIAYCDASGPLEKKPETYFAISPTPAAWTKARSLSFYREYNRSMLANLTVHEAMPGHFLQLMHANRYRSDVRAVFSSGVFVEGWAVYGEWLMAKHGFGGPKVRLMRQKMILRSCANAVLDHEVHASTMDEKAALALMVDQGFQEEGEAVGKWRRARLTSAQLSTYFFGFREMLKLRDDAEKRSGFSERSFHDRLLSFGSPPLRHMRELLSETTR